MKYVTNHLSENPTGWWVGTDFVEIQAEDVGKVLGIVEDSNGNPAWGVVPGGSLPDVTGSDDGKVLGVVSGEWAKMNSPYQEFIIGISLGANDSFIVDTPAATIVDAVEAGKRCRIRFNFIAQFLFDIAFIRHQPNGDIDINTAPFPWEGSWKGFHVALVKENNIWTATATIYNP